MFWPFYPSFTKCFRIIIMITVLQLEWQWLVIQVKVCLALILINWLKSFYGSTCKDFFDSIVTEAAGLKELMYIIIICEFNSSLPFDLPTWKVCLVAYQVYLDIFWSVRIYFFKINVQLVKAFLLSDVIGDKNAVGTTIEQICYGSILFITSLNRNKKLMT